MRQTCPICGGAGDVVMKPCRACQGDGRSKNRRTINLKIPAGVETGRVAREALLLGPSLTGVLNRMERDGLIARNRCPQDARRTVVRATPAGLKLVRALSQTIESHYQWMEAQLGKQRLAQLYDLLDDVIALEAPGGVEADDIEE